MISNFQWYSIFQTYTLTKQVSRFDDVNPLNSNKWNSLSISEYSLIISTKSFTYSMCGRINFSFLKNTIPVSFDQHGFRILYQLQNKKNQLSELCYNFFFRLFADKLGAIFCEFRDIYVKTFFSKILQLLMIIIIIFALL